MNSKYAERFCDFFFHLFCIVNTSLKWDSVCVGHVSHTVYSCNFYILYKNNVFCKSVLLVHTIPRKCHGESKSLYTTYSVSYAVKRECCQLLVI